MKKTLLIINQMADEGLFEKYAIGGGIATIFYMKTSYLKFRRKFYES